MAKTVLTYGTCDLFHVGHLNILKRLKEKGDRLIVGVSTDEFNAIKGKKPIVPFEQRLEIVQAIQYVDEAFPEENWEQKRGRQYAATPPSYSLSASSPARMTTCVHFASLITVLTLDSQFKQRGQSVASNQQ